MKTIKRLFILVLFLVMPFVLTGCSRGFDGSDDDYAETGGRDVVENDEVMCTQ